MNVRDVASGVLPVTLVQALRSRYGVAVDSSKPLLRGYDVSTRKWVAETADGRFVVRADMRTPEAAAHWVGQAVASAGRAGVPCLAPRRTRDGRFAVAYDGGAAALLPFAPGRQLDRDSAHECAAAGVALAQLHTWVGQPPTERPSPSIWDARYWPGRNDPPQLRDAALDVWHTEFLRHDGGGLRRGLIHGDFYADNVIWSADGIAAIIDWSEARVDIVVRELAFAVWEFGHNETGDALDPERARVFLSGYRTVAGELGSATANALVPLMRFELRQNMRYALASSDPDDAEYAVAGQRAFVALRDQDASALLA